MSQSRKGDKLIATVYKARHAKKDKYILMTVKAIYL